MTGKKYNLSFLLGLFALAFSHLNAMEQFSNVVERFKGYSPYLVAPAINRKLYNYRKNIPIEQRYFNPALAYFGAPAASTLASTLLNRDSGWSSALGWALIKNIPAWASTGLCYRNEIIDDQTTKEQAINKAEQSLLAKQKFIDQFLKRIDSNIHTSLSLDNLKKPTEDIKFIKEHIELSRIILPDQKNNYYNKINALSSLLEAKEEQFTQNKKPSAKISLHGHPDLTPLKPASDDIHPVEPSITPPYQESPSTGEEIKEAFPAVPLP